MPLKRLALFTSAFVCLIGLSLQAQVDLGGTKQDIKGSGGSSGSGSTSGNGTGTSGTGTSSGSGSGTSGSGANSGTGSSTSSGSTSGGTKQDVKGNGSGSTSGGGSTSGSGTKGSGGSGNNPAPTGTATGGSSGSSGAKSHTSSSDSGSTSNTPTGVSPTWVTPWAQAVESATQSDRPILAYIHPAGQTTDPADFTVQDIVDSSRLTFVFFKQPFDAKAPEMALLGVKRTTALIGTDKYGNEFKRTDQARLAEIRKILAETPELIRKFVEKLQADFARAEEAAVGNDSAKTLKLYLAITTLNRKGYLEIRKAREWATNEGRERLRRIASLPEARIVREQLAALAALFKGTPPAAEAELRLARMDFEEGRIAPGIGRLSRVSKLDWEDAKEIAQTAKTDLDAAIAAGLKKVDAALEIAALGDPASARVQLRKIQTDYDGTAVAEKAADALLAIP